MFNLDESDFNRVHNNGYRYAFCRNHPLADKFGFVFEHRYRMAQSLNRMLTNDEVVHHQDGNKENNNINNLKLMNQSTHANLHNQVRRKINIDPVVLQKMLLCKPTTHIAQELGVSDKAIEKYATKHNLTKPPRGHWTDSVQPEMFQIQHNKRRKQMQIETNDLVKLTLQL